MPIPNPFTDRLRPRAAEPADTPFFNIYPDRLVILGIYYVVLNQWRVPEFILIGPPLNALHYFRFASRLDTRADIRELHSIGDVIRHDVIGRYSREWMEIVYFTWRVYAPVLVQDLNHQQVEALLRSALVRRNSGGDTVDLVENRLLNGSVICSYFRQRLGEVPVGTLVFHMILHTQTCEVINY
ncbi:hypothetical protein BJX70DRAFT_398964 [Aspergillus crustosus]